VVGNGALVPVVHVADRDALSRPPYWNA
jgi:hypothetical protein